MGIATHGSQHLSTFRSSELEIFWDSIYDVSMVLQCYHQKKVLVVLLHLSTDEYRAKEAEFTQATSHGVANLEEKIIPRLPDN